MVITCFPQHYVENKIQKYLEQSLKNSINKFAEFFFSAEWSGKVSKFKCS